MVIKRSDVNLWYVFSEPVLFHWNIKSNVFSPILSLVVSVRKAMTD